MWLEARTTAVQREVIHKIGGEGFAFAQTAFKEVGGFMGLYSIPHCLWQNRAPRKGMSGV